MRRAGNRQPFAKHIAPTSDNFACSGKRMYPTFRDATHVASLVRKHKDGERMSAYRCRHCSSWHIGGNGTLKLPKK